jgi:hypothetical protein
VIPLAALALIDKRAAARIPPTPGEAARLMSLISDRSTSLEPTAVSLPEPEGQDPGLLERIRARGAEQHGRVGVHPDVYYALGLFVHPHHTWLPPRPQPPHEPDSGP